MNEASGNQVWSWQPNQGTVQIIAATAGGGVAVLNIVGNQEDVVRLDSSDNATYDTWGTAGGSAGYGVLSNASYFAGLWYGVGGDPVFEGMVGQPEEEAFTAWPDPDGGAPNNGGSKQAVIYQYHFVPRAITGIDYQQVVEDSVPEGSNTNFQIPVRHVFVMNSKATADRFITDLRSGAAAVAFVGDSIGYPSGNGTTVRYGLWFYNQILASPNAPAGVAEYQGSAIMRRSIGDIAPDTQVLFIGACEFDSNMSQWLVPVKTKGQAFILPTQPVPTYLGPVTEAWVATLANLASGNNVTTSVNNGNLYLKQNPPSPPPTGPVPYVRPIWGVAGDGTFTIKASQ